MNTKIKINIIIAFLFICTSTIFAQAKKPTIMVVPSDVWCTKNGYMTEYNNQGTVVKIPDYKRAFQESAELSLVISKINELMAERGFQLKLMESAIKSLSEQSAEDAMATSKDGAQISETPIDKLKKVAKADIWMQITWTVNQTGPKKSITFNLQGIDAYTDKQIAGASGTGEPSFSAETPVLLEESVLAHLDNFNSQLQSHFDDMFANGREITFRIKVWDNFEGGLDKDLGGKELNAVIENWISKNTVRGSFSTTDATENMMFFEQVRIPLYDANNKAINARDWAKGLQKMLKDTYQIETKLTMKGLGQAQLIIGGK